MKFPDLGGNNSSGRAAGVFIKMKDGDRLQGIFKGDPHIFRQHWVSGRSHLCTGKDQCEHCKAGDKPKFRFRINFIVREDGVPVAKIFEQGYGVYKDLKEMHENSYELPETLVSISRSGEGTNTRYTIMPVKNNGGLKPAEFKNFDKIPLNQLSDKAPEEDTSFDPAELEGEAS